MYLLRALKQVRRTAREWAWLDGITMKRVASFHIIQSLHAGTLPVTPPRVCHLTLRKLLWRKLVTLMLSCSGRNYNFRCIGLSVVFGVLFRETARTAANSRNNRSTNSRKATKRVDRLAPILAHWCRYIWEWIYAKQIAPRATRGALGGGGGG